MRVFERKLFKKSGRGKLSVMNNEEQAQGKIEDRPSNPRETTGRGGRMCRVQVC